MPSMSMWRGSSTVFRLTRNLLVGGNSPSRVLAAERLMRRVTPSLLLAFVIGCGSDLRSDPTQIEAAQSLHTVTRVIDGDTVVVEGVGCDYRKVERRPGHFILKPATCVSVLAVPRRCSRPSGYRQ
jgi:hypothetical protein